MNYLDLKYVRLVSGYLSQWKEVGRDLSRFRCPFCGDSKKNKSLARGYFFSLDDKALFKCHNCGVALPLGKFLSEIAPALASEYKFEKFETHKRPQFKKEADEDRFVTTTQHRLRRTKSVLDICQRILSLPEEHHARQYLDGRLIPENMQAKLFYIENVQELAKKIPGYRDRKLRAMDAIIIPFFDEDSCLMYLQCRFFDEDFRYMTFQVEDEGKKIWGLDRVDWTKRVYVCEGPFDAMFLDNCIAVAGASIMSEIKYFRERATNELVLIFDKDYRSNAEVFSMLKDAVDAGHKVVLYDSTFVAKDLNAQIEEGWTEDQLRKYLERRTFSGLMAKLELAKIRPPKKRKYGPRTQEERYVHV